MSHEIGLYVHIPFCKAKCYYCDFNSYPGLDSLIPEYINALKTEIEIYAGKLKDKKISTIYIGGGTPSILDGASIDSLLKVIFRNFSVCKDAEITIESNPGTLDSSKLHAYHSAGINRLSIGLQSWQDRLLKSIGRIHTANDFIVNFNEARNAGFMNINIDLMFGLPGQTMEDWMSTLQNVISLKPEHISCYSLKVEEGTPMDKLIQEDESLAIPEELDRMMYHHVVRELKKSGYRHYEISNFALSGFESRHNMIYWNACEYLGVGAGSHSYILGERFGNEESPSEYINKINLKGSASYSEGIIDTMESIKEYMILGLRLIDGISPEHFEKRYGINIYELYGEKIEELKSRGLLKTEDNRICLTETGLDLANQVFVEFI